MRLKVTILIAACLLMNAACITAKSTDSKRILVVYHSGTPPYRLSMPLEQNNVDALSQATVRQTNADFVARKIRTMLTARGHVVDLKMAMDIKGPVELLEYDGLIFGTPTWFSNVAYPLKRVFDEHLVRVYEHREGRLNDKVLGSFVTVMERGRSGMRCLKALNWSLEQLSDNVVNGVLINVQDPHETVSTLIDKFCTRYSKRLMR